MFRTSYAVVWRDGDGPVNAGSSCSALRACAWRPVAVSAARRQGHPLRGLTSVANAAPSDRIRSRPTVITDRRSRDPLSAAAVNGMGSVREIVERLASRLTLGTAL